MNAKETLTGLKSKIRLCYNKVHTLLKIFFLFIPLTIASLSFLYTLFGQSHEEFSLWQNIYVSLFWGYGTAIVIFLFGIPFQLISNISNRSISINNVKTSDPEQLFDTLKVLELFIYCIMYGVLRVAFIFRK